MSTNSNTQQINVFNKGMNTDTSDAYLPAEQYRYAENLRFLTNEGENSGELRLIEGYKKIEQLLNEQEEVKAVTSIRNLIVILSNDTAAQIHIIDKDKIGTKKENKEWFPFLAKNDKWNSDHYSLVTRYEDEDNIKLYVADGINPLRAFSIHKGATNPDNFDDVDTAGGVNVFGGFKIYDDGNLYIRTNGLLKPGIVQYAYILYTKYKGTSNVSPSTKPISVYILSDIHKGVMQDLYTSVGLELTILENKNTTPYERILVYRISYEQVGLQPNIDLLYDEQLKDSYFTFTDSGQEPLTSNTTFAEFLSYNFINSIPNYIESKNDYLFAANVRYMADTNILAMYNNWDATAHPDKSTSFTNDYNFPILFSGKNVSWKLITHSEVLTDNHSNYVSLLRDEVYRYGIILYDKDGYKWPVKWIADIRTPPANAGIKESSTVSVNDGQIYTNSLGIEFTINNLDNDVFPYYEIVRCDRNYKDSHTKCQGIVGRAMYNSLSLNTNTYFPSGFITMGKVVASSYDGDLDLLTSATTENSKVFLFASPEICYNNQIAEYIKSYTDAESILKLNVITYHNIDHNNMSTDDWLTADNGTLSHERADLIQFGNDGLRLAQRPDYSYARDPFVEHVVTEVSGGNLMLCLPDSNLLHHPFGGNVGEYLDYDSLGQPKLNRLKLIYPAQNLFELSKVISPVTINEKANIKKIKVVDSAEKDTFSLNDAFTYNSNPSYIGEYKFINWSTAMIEMAVQNDPNNLISLYKDGRKSSYNEDKYIFPMDYQETSIPDLYKHTFTHEFWAYRYPIGTGGKCMLFTVDSDLQLLYNSISQVSIANVQIDNITPYGGTDEYHLNLSVYTSRGNYFQNDSQAHAVFDGDCFILNFYYNALHTWRDGQSTYAPRMSTVYVIPLETRIDMNSDSGDSYKRLKNLSGKLKRYVQDYTVSELYDYSQGSDAYMYNTAYSSEPTLLVSTSENEDDLKNNSFDYRILYSLQKTNNETTDSWLKFMSANYLDVDTRYGEITDLRLFKNTLMFWQKDATGVLSVNERTMLQDVNDTNIILGNGDVLQRYDYLTTEYGMAPEQMCETLSDTTLYWWDQYRKEILAYSGGLLVLPMKKPKTISSLINRGQLINKPKMSYDHKYHEVLMHVVNIPYIEYLKRFENNFPVDGFENDFIIAEERFNRYPIVYNEIVQQFTSAYTTPFEHSVIVNGKNYMFENNDVYEWNKVGEELYPRLRYVVNANSTFTKTYDNVQLGMGESFYYDLFYNSEPDTTKRDNQPLTFAFRTIGQQSQLDKNITNREYDLRFAIPRDKDAQYGGRMRGRTMQCELTSSSSSTDFSIQYIITKYRISWS